MFIIRPCVIGLALFILFVNNGFAQRGPDNRHQNASATTSIQFAQALRSSVDQMLERSGTFREQYRRIAETQSLMVGVLVDVRLCQTTDRARTTFRRYQSGLIVADVVIAPGSHPGEWIAHEFEHILELLDGRNLPQLASNHAKDVWYSGSDVIETDRAIRAGRTVRDEMRQSQRTQ
jgi:hypothetical protein